MKEKMSAKKTGLSYVLVTPARNESQYIELTILSVLSQTHLPLRWVIVDDGSQDLTGEIVREYARSHEWIVPVSLPAERKRSFAGKVSAFYAGYELVRGLNFEVIGNLDADISFEEDFLEYLLDRFSEDDKLGVAGTPFVEDGYSSTQNSFEGETHVPGGCQLFRRRCFEDIGGYIPVKGGGIDWIAVTTARMKGWGTRSFRERQFHHHRSLGTGETNRVSAVFSYGMKDYFLGGHPLWEVFRVAYRSTQKPYLMEGMLLMGGYVWAWMSRVQRPVSPELMAFHRGEQIDKLRKLAGLVFRGCGIDKFKLAARSEKGVGDD